MKIKKFNEEIDFENDWDEDVEETKPHEFNNIRLNIGRRIVVNRPTNVYRLTVTSMHGDADAYTKNHVDFTKEQLNRLKLVIYILRKIYDGVYRDNFSRELRKHQDIFNEVYGRNYDINDYFYDIIDHDMTTDGQFWCGIDRYVVNYYNNNGEKFQVNIN